MLRGTKNLKLVTYRVYNWLNRRLLQEGQWLRRLLSSRRKGMKWCRFLFPIRQSLSILSTLSCLEREISQVLTQLWRANLWLMSILSLLSSPIDAVAYKVSLSASFRRNQLALGDQSKLWREEVWMSMWITPEGCTKCSKISSSTGGLKKLTFWLYQVSGAKPPTMEVQKMAPSLPHTPTSSISSGCVSQVYLSPQRRRMNFTMKATMRIQSLSWLETTLKTLRECPSVFK